MDKTALESLVRQNKSTRQIASYLSTSQTNVRYWLSTYGLKTQRSPKNKGHRTKWSNCSLCGREQNTKKDRCQKKCDSCYTLIRRIRLRKAAFAYKGGRCAICARSDGPLSAYDFHHPDANKEFAISRAYYSKKKIRKELDKCVLLCAFCHRVQHSIERGTDIEIAVNERGFDLDA